MRRRLFAALAAGVLLVTLAAGGSFALSRPAAIAGLAATTTTTQSDFLISNMYPQPVAPGTVGFVLGQGCNLGQKTVALRLEAGDGTTVWTSPSPDGTADDSGAWSAPVEVPVDLTPGDYTVVATCIGSGYPEARQPFTVAGTVPDGGGTFDASHLLNDASIARVTPGTKVTIDGTGCSSVAGHVEVFFAADGAPLTRLAENDGFIGAENGQPGDWSGTLTVPQVAPAWTYFVAAQCWGDGFRQGHPGEQVEYFGYVPRMFIVSDPDTTTTSTTTVPNGPAFDVDPGAGATGTHVHVSGTNCISDAGSILVLFTTTAEPGTPIVEAGTPAQEFQPGDWDVDLVVPAVGPGDYEIGAQCWGDGTPFGHGGEQVEYFAYAPQLFTVTSETPTTVSSGPGFAVGPITGPAGTHVKAMGANCLSDAGHIEVFFTTTNDPDTRLAESDAIAMSVEPGSWSVDLYVPAVSAGDYEIGAQCWGDGTPLGHPGEQVEYYAYAPQPFTVTETSPTTTPTGPPSTTTPTTVKVTQESVPSGYLMLDAQGHVYAFGHALWNGNAPGPAVAIAVRNDGLGYWITDAQGRVHGFGLASNLGAPPIVRAHEVVTTIAATPSDNGYWLFTNLGRAFAYGDAHFYGDMGAIPLNGGIVASAATPTGRGYYMVGSDGGVFAFGDARFHGSMGGIPLNQPVTALASDRGNGGYWLVASDGGVFAFGDAPFRGSMGGIPLNRPVNAISSYGNGYLMVASDGGLFTFSDLPFLGSLGGRPTLAPIVGFATFG